MTRPLQWMGVCLSAVTALAPPSALARGCSVVLAAPPTVAENLLRNEPLPDMVLADFTGIEWGTINCSGISAGEMRFQPAFAGLNYVRDVTIQGERYPAYETSSTSVLVALRIRDNHSDGSSSFRPIDIRQPVTWPSPNFDVSEQHNVMVQLAFVSRGGDMASQGLLSIGGGRTSPVRLPSVGIEHAVSLDVKLIAPTCSLVPVTLTLPGVRLSELAQSGDVEATMDLNAVMNCPVDGVQAALTLTDVHGNSGSAGELSPTADSSARGVRIRLLRNSVPVVFGQPWDHGAAHQGRNVIRLQAQYRRTADPAAPGSLRGEALLTADYQ